MVSKKGKPPIALGSVEVLQKKRQEERKVDRSDRVVKPGTGTALYDEDPPAPKDEPLLQKSELLKDTTTSSGVVAKPKPATSDKSNKRHPSPSGPVNTASGEALKESSKPQALSVLLRSQEYTMYTEIIEKINALGPPKKVSGTDIQRASIHLLYKMTPGKILKAHLQLMMTVGAPTENDGKKALSVLLQPRERKMFYKIIDKINALGVSKKIKGTDIQRASIYILCKMKPERILKAHFQSLMP